MMKNTMNDLIPVVFERAVDSQLLMLIMRLVLNFNNE